MHIDHFTRC